MGARHAPVCFVTAATESFVPGTLVTICSFLKHHPAFDGDVVVIHDALPASRRQCLQDACGKVRFERVRRQKRPRNPDDTTLFGTLAGMAGAPLLDYSRPPAAMIIRETVLDVRKEETPSNHRTPMDRRK